MDAPFYWCWEQNIIIRAFPLKVFFLSFLESPPQSEVITKKSPHSHQGRWIDMNQPCYCTLQKKADFMVLKIEFLFAVAKWRNRVKGREVANFCYTVVKASLRREYKFFGLGQNCNNAMQHPSWHAKITLLLEVCGQKAVKQGFSSLTMKGHFPISLLPLLKALKKWPLFFY